MGLFDVLKGFLTNPEHEKALDEEVKVLEDLANANIKLWNAEIDKMFLDQSGMKNLGKVAGTKRQAERQEVAVFIKEKADESINKAVDDLFDFSLDGLKKAGLGLIKSGLSTFLGDYESGVFEQRQAILVPQAAGIFRLDAWIWRRKFSVGGLLTEQKEVVAMYLVTSSVNLKKLAEENPEVLLNTVNDLVSHLPANEQTEAIVNKLSEWKKLWKAATEGWGAANVALTTDWIKVSDAVDAIDAIDVAAMVAAREPIE